MSPSLRSPAEPRASTETLSATLDARVAQLLAEPGGLAQPVSQSIRPAQRADHAGGAGSLEAFRELAARRRPVELGRVLGAGGMGVVHAGRQTALGREVAVKMLRSQAFGELAELQLLREAWTTGLLEHPNIVPVHDICLDSEQRPQIVLKKIEGSSWANLMRDAATVESSFRARDLLEWNLRILMQVCNALHFAHSRGIVHRDLKPENVMVGEFGEVYVLDWGIAVALHHNADKRLPLAADAHELAGTPGYMAPEMLGGQASQLSARTDVYLLGAILYEMVSGHAPHRGANLAEALRDIVLSKPPLPAGTAPELANIVRRAMSVEPADRFESAEQLHNALMDFVEHRGAHRLAEEAEARLSELEAALGNPLADPDAQRLRVYPLFAECRFGFMQSLRIWRDNQRALSGLRRAIISMAELELAQGDARAAAALLTELEQAPPELSERVVRAKQQRDLEDARHAALVRDNDPSIGRRTRVLLGSIFGLTWTLVPFIAYRYERLHRGALDYQVASLAGLGLLLGGGMLWLAGGKTLLRTAMNRRLVRAVSVALIAQLAFNLGAWSLDLEYARSQPLLLLNFAVVATLAATSIERGLWPSALAFWLAFALACARPPFAYLLASAGNLALTLNIIALWARVDEDVVAPLREGRAARRLR